MAPRFIVASAADVDWLIEQDAHVGAEWVVRCVALKEYFVAVDGEVRRGYLRFSRFWGRIPYLEMIQVDPEWRGVGIGYGLLCAWEEAMRAEGANLAMTSAMSSEPDPQAWHRMNGYEPSGELTFGAAQPTPEVFFVKAL